MNITKEYRVKFIGHDGDIMEDIQIITKPNEDIIDEIEKYSIEFIEEDELYDIVYDLVDVY